MVEMASGKVGFKYRIDREIYCRRVKTERFKNESSEEFKRKKGIGGRNWH